MPKFCNLNNLLVAVLCVSLVMMLLTSIIAIDSSNQAIDWSNSDLQNAIEGFEGRENVDWGAIEAPAELDQHFDNVIDPGQNQGFTIDGDTLQTLKDNQESWKAQAEHLVDCDGATAAKLNIPEYTDFDFSKFCNADGNVTPGEHILTRHEHNNLWTNNNNHDIRSLTGEYNDFLDGSNTTPGATVQAALIGTSGGLAAGAAAWLGIKKYGNNGWKAWVTCICLLMLFVGGVVLGTMGASSNNMVFMGLGVALGFVAPCGYLIVANFYAEPFGLATDSDNFSEKNEYNDSANYTSIRRRLITLERMMSNVSINRNEA